MAGRKVKCKLCKTELDKDKSYCIEKKSEKTGKITREYYCSIEEYEKNKRNKELWLENMRIFDSIIGYVCVSKVKTNEFKALEENFTREQIYNCLEKNKAEIKRYLDEKNIVDEYGKIVYIFACIKNKIRDDSNEFTISGNVGNNQQEDIVFETDEEVLNRIDEERNRPKQHSIFEILNKINGGDKRDDR